MSNARWRRQRPVRSALCSLSKPPAVHERQDVLDQVSSNRRNVALSDAWASRPQEWGPNDPADGGRVNYSMSEAKTAVPGNTITLATLPVTSSMSIFGDCNSPQGELVRRWG